MANGLKRMKLLRRCESRAKRANSCASRSLNCPDLQYSSTQSPSMALALVDRKVWNAKLTFVVLLDDLLTAPLRKHNFYQVLWDGVRVRVRVCVSGLTLASLACEVHAYRFPYPHAS